MKISKSLIIKIVRNIRAALVYSFSLLCAYNILKFLLFPPNSFFPSLLYLVFFLPVCIATYMLAKSLKTNYWSYLSSKIIFLFLSLERLIAFITSYKVYFRHLNPLYQHHEYSYQYYFVRMIEVILYIIILFLGLVNMDLPKHHEKKGSVIKVIKVVLLSLILAWMIRIVLNGFIFRPLWESTDPLYLSIP